MAENSTKQKQTAARGGKGFLDGRKKKVMIKNRVIKWGGGDKPG